MVVTMNRIIKICQKCNEEQTHAVKKNGTVQHHCMRCQREYSRQNYLLMKGVHNPKRYELRRKQAKILREFINNLKSDPCTDCGQTFLPIVMDFDHLRDKEFLIGRAVSEGFSVEKIQVEIDKCELVCSNCHRIRTWKRQQNLPL